VHALATFYRENIASPTPDFIARAQVGDAVKIVAAGAGSAACFVASTPDSFTPGGLLPADKLQHWSANFLITVVGSAVVGMPPWLAATTSFTLGTVGKELVWDRMLGRGTPDVKDVLANASGALAGYSVAKMLERARG